MTNNERILDLLIEKADDDVTVFQSIKSITLPEHSQILASEMIKAIDHFSKYSDDDLINIISDVYDYAYKLGYFNGFRDKGMKDDLQEMQILADYFNRL